MGSIANAKERKPIEPPKMPCTVKEYEASPYWREKSKRILLNKECECAICHRKRWKEYKRKKGAYRRMLRFSVHHVNYSNIPYEKPEDLVILCFQCHDICHLILRLEHMHEFYHKLADVVRQYFSYDRESWR